MNPKEVNILCDYISVPNLLLTLLNKTIYLEKRATNLHLLDVWCRSQLMSLYAYPHAAYHSLPPRLPDPMRTRMPPDAGTGWHRAQG